MDTPPTVPYADQMAFANPPYGGGLTRRELFAAMAMQGMMADGKARDELAETEHCYKVHAIHAVLMADALLAALEKKV